MHSACWLLSRQGIIGPKTTQNLLNWHAMIPMKGITYSSGGYKLKRYISFSSKSGATSWTKGVKWAPNFVPRVEWEARDPTGISNFNHPASTGVIGHHTAGHRCFSKSECMSRVRGIQNYHMDSNNWSDIGYNWLIGDDGRIYEGRGPYRQGAHWYVTNFNDL